LCEYYTRVLVYTFSQLVRSSGHLIYRGLYFLYLRGPFVLQACLRLNCSRNSWRLVAVVFAWACAPPAEPTRSQTRPRPTVRKPPPKRHGPATTRTSSRNGARSAYIQTTEADQNEPQLDSQFGVYISNKINYTPASRREFPDCHWPIYSLLIPCAATPPSPPPPPPHALWPSLAAYILPQKPNA
jgi:hypothetical protein